MNEWLTANFPAIAAILSSIAIVLGAGTWVGSITAKTGSFKRTLDEIGTKLDKVVNKLDKVVNKLDILVDRTRARTTESGSPLKLSEIGRRVSETINAKGIAGEHTSNLVDELRGKKRYEIQDFAFDYVYSDEFDLPIETQELLRQCAYDEALPLNDVKVVIALELRDQLIELIGPD